MSTTVNHFNRGSSVLEHSLDAYVAANGIGQIVSWNAAASRMFGWTAEQAIGRDAIALIVPDVDRDARIDALRRCRAAQADALSVRLELEASTHDGVTLPVEVSLFSIGEADGSQTFHAFLRDITDRREVVRAQRVAAAVVASSADAIVVLNEREEINDCNPAAERLFGWPRTAAVGHPITELIPAHLRAESDELTRRALGGAPVVGHETVRLRRDGTAVDVAVTVVRLSDADGREICTATYRDISARKRAERELADHSARLKGLAAAERLITDSSTGADPRAGRPEEIVRGLIKLAREHLAMDVVCLEQLEGARFRVRALAGDGGSYGLIAGGSVAVEETLCGQMLKGHVPAALPDVAADPVASRVPGVRERNVAAYVGVPVRLRDGRLYGALCAADHVSRPALGDRELSFLAVLAGVLAAHVDRREPDRNPHRTRSEQTALDALLAALDARDWYTGEHSHAVVDLSRTVARRLGLDDRQAEVVGQVALLHDLGKVGIPDAILQKPGPLDAAEWELMREHPAIGARIVATIEPLAHLTGAVRAEHERWDGRGYPDGLVGRDIPIEARITLACDAYHAMTSDRPYRRALGHVAALAELRRHAGSQFDPGVIAALTAVLAD